MGVFFITGSASGIGLHLATSLLDRGDSVYATDLALDQLEDEAKRLSWSTDRLRIRRLDVRDPKQWEECMTEAAAEFGRVDVLMNIAGYLHPSWINQITIEDVDRHFDVNVKGVVFGTQAATRIMSAQGEGQIINIASIAGLAPLPGLSLYSASKFAVRAFTLSVASELRRKNIYPTVICPDGVMTPMLEKESAYEESALVFSGTRILTVEDISDVIFNHVLRYKPLEVWIPRSRGWLATLGNLFPRLLLAMEPVFRNRGLVRQKVIRELIQESGRAHPTNRRF